jgi:hypothetical protein
MRVLDSFPAVAVEEEGEGGPAHEEEALSLAGVTWDEFPVDIQPLAPLDIELAGLASKQAELLLASSGPPEPFGRELFEGFHAFDIDNGIAGVAVAVEPQNYFEHCSSKQGPLKVGELEQNLAELLSNNLAAA